MRQRRSGNIFQRRWAAFRKGSGFNDEAASSQLFPCACTTLGDALLKVDPDITDKDVDTVLTVMKQLAVIPVAVGVIRAEFVQMQQSRDELFRAFAARVRGKAETCAYAKKCTCGLSVDFTDQMTRDVLIAGIADLDIRREVLGTPGVLAKPLNDIISCVEGKEMARNALPGHPTISVVSSFKRSKATQPGDKGDSKPKDNCPTCGNGFFPYTKNAAGKWNTRPHSVCLDCFGAQRNRRKEGGENNIVQAAECGVIVAHISTVQAASLVNSATSEINLAHHVHAGGGWHRARFREHPTTRLQIPTTREDYDAFGLQAPYLSACDFINIVSYWLLGNLFHHCNYSIHRIFKTIQDIRSCGT